MGWDQNILLKEIVEIICCLHRIRSNALQTNFTAIHAPCAHHDKIHKLYDLATCCFINFPILINVR